MNNYCDSDFMFFDFWFCFSYILLMYGAISDTGDRKTNSNSWKNSLIISNLNPAQGGRNWWRLFSQRTWKLGIRSAPYKTSGWSQRHKIKILYVVVPEIIGNKNCEQIYITTIITTTNKYKISSVMSFGHFLKNWRDRNSRFNSRLIYTITCGKFFLFPFYSL